jgi:hypothetical protein
MLRFAEFLRGNFLRNCFGWLLSPVTIAEVAGRRGQHRVEG